MRLLKNISLLSLFLFYFSMSSQAQFSNKGKDFWLVFAECIDRTYTGGTPGVIDPNIDPIVLIIYVASKNGTKGRITLASDPSFVQEFTVKPNDIELVIFRDTRSVNSLMTTKRFYQEISNQGIRVQTDDDVAVYAQIFQQFFNSASLIFPTETLGSKYVIPNYNEEDIVIDPTDDPTFTSRQFSVIATEDNTEIEVTPSTDSFPGLFPARRKDETFSIMLNKGQVYTFFGDIHSDVSGSFVQSKDCNKPIAVFSAAQYARIGCRLPESGDNFYQQLLPIEAWGNSFVVIPFKNRYFGIVKIFGNKVDTQVEIQGQGTISLNASNNYTYETEFNAPLIITADKPVSVAQFMVTQNCDNERTNRDENIIANQSDPDMLILSPINQSTNDIIFYSARQNSTLGKSEIIVHYVNVVIETIAVPSLRLNGQDVSNEFKVLDGTEYSYAQIEITDHVEGLSPVSKISADKKFTAIAYGYGYVESYSYLAGTRLVRDPQTLVLYYNKETGKFKNTSVICSNEEIALYIKSFEEIESISYTLTPKDSTRKLIKSTDFRNKYSAAFSYFYELPIDKNQIADGENYLNMEITFKKNGFTNACKDLKATKIETFTYNAIKADFNIDLDPCLSEVATMTSKSIHYGLLSDVLWNIDNSKFSSTKEYVVKNLTFDEHEATFSFTDTLGCSASAVKTFVFQNNDVYTTTREVNLYNASTGAKKIDPFICPNESTYVRTRFLNTSRIQSVTWSVQPSNAGPYPAREVRDAQTARDYIFDIYPNNDDFVAGQTNTVMFDVLYGCTTIPETFQFEFNYSALEVDATYNGYPCSGITFSDQSTGVTSVFTRTWELSTGLITSVSNFTVYNFVPNDYMVALTIADSKGCVGKDEFQFKIWDTNTRPRETYPEQDIICGGESQVITLKLSFDPDRIIWYPSTGNKSVVINNPTYTLFDEVNTTYYYTFEQGPSNIVSNLFSVSYENFINKCVPFTDSFNGIYTNSLLEAKMDVDVFDCDVDKKAIFTNKSDYTLDITNILWNSSTGTSSVVDTFIITSVREDGNYMFTLTIEDTNNCKSYTNTTLFLEADNFLELNALDTFLCVTSDIYVIVNDFCKINKASTLSYVWNVNGQNVKGNTYNIFVDINTLKEEQNTIKYTVFINNNEEYSVSKNIHINAIVDAGLALGDNIQLCNDFTVTIDNTSIMLGNELITRVVWYPEANINSNESIVYEDPYTINGLLKPLQYFYPRNPISDFSDHLIKIEVFTENCSDTALLTFTLENNPILELATNRIELCRSESTTFMPFSSSYIKQAELKNNNILSAHIDGEPIPSVVDKIDIAAGVHQLSYMLSGTICINTKNIPLEVYDNGSVQFNQESFFREEYGIIEMEYNSYNNLSYTIHWSPNVEQEQRNLERPTIALRDNEEFYVTITNEKNCVLKTQTTIRLFDKQFVNSFTPNNDNINDVFEFDDFKDYFPKSELRIYNVWGQEIYYSDIIEWDGTVDGKPLAFGVYFYQLHLNDKRDRTVQGFIQLFDNKHSFPVSE